MSAPKNAKLSDVAARVGVSAITVSRALRTPEKVSPQLRKEIARAVAELGYVPNPAARALASRQSDVIGVVIPSVTNNVFAEVVQGIHSEMEHHPFNMQLAYTRYSPRTEENLLKVFLSQNPAGLIVTGIDQSDAARAMLKAAPCPVVQIMETAENPIDLMIGFSHYDAARAAATHLLEQGYRRLAFLGARMDPRSQRRFQGFRDGAMAGDAYSEARVVTSPAPSSVSLGAEFLGELLTNAPDFDAIFCNNDDLALGVMFEAQRRRIQIPDQIGLCGFNDLDMMAVAEPTITSVKTFRHEMGRQAVEMLVARIAGEDGPSQTVVDLGFEVRARRSTRRPSRG